MSPHPLCLNLCLWQSNSLKSGIGWSFLGIDLYVSGKARKSKKSGIVWALRRLNSLNRKNNPSLKGSFYKAFLPLNVILVLKDGD